MDKTLIYQIPRNGANSRGLLNARVQGFDNIVG